MISWMLAGGLAAPAALCNDYYVDALNGSNSNSGTTPSGAWRTLTFAMSQLPASQNNTVFVAQGTYDAALGEAFPIRIEDRVAVVGEGESVVTFDAGGTVAFAIDDSNGPVSSGTSLRGVCITGATIGVRIRSDSNLVSCSLADFTIDSATASGVLLLADPGPSGQLDVTLSAVTTSTCNTGLSVAADCPSIGAFNLFVTVHCSDCRFTDSIVHGCSLSLSDPDTIMTAVLDRTSITGSGGDAIHIETFEIGGVSLRVNDSILGRNGQSGLNDVFDVATVQLWRSTIASNGGMGVNARGQLAVLQDCILFGNNDDLGPGSTPFSASFNNIGDGDLAGTNGNISVDPLFTDPVSGDFTPGFGTACIDGGSPASVGLTDLFSRPRRTDGDLDLVHGADMGAIELPTLALSGSTAIGGTLDLLLQGEVGTFGLVQLARGLPSQSPIPSPFGEMYLDPQRRVPVALVRTGPPPGAPLSFSIPPDPALIGLAASFQSLNRSSRSAAGAAWTDVVSFTVTE